MKITDGFLEQGFEQARRALAEIRGRAGLQLEPKTITKSLRARTRSRLKALEVIVRRLIVLLASRIILAPSAAQPAKPAPSVPDGVEDVTASFRACHASYSFRLMPAPCALGFDWAAPDPEKGRLVPVPGPVPAAPLIARIAALHRLLRATDDAARRMARTLQRMKAEGEPRPLCLPEAGGFRLHAELGIVAAALPGLVATAFADWPLPGAVPGADRGIDSS